MFHLPLPFTDLNLFLAPRWGEAPRPLDVLPWLVVCLVPLGLVLWLYRYELRLISRAAALLLLGLRLAVLFILLFLVCLQPALARTTREDVPQRVYVVVDRTASMEVADPQREPVEKLRLAGALHLARDVCSDLQIEEWVRAYEKGGGPRWVADDEHPDDPERRKQLEAERRRQHDQVCQRVDGFTRNQLARRLLDADGAGLLKKLSGRFQVELIGFAGETWDAPPDKLDEVFGKDVRPRSPALAFTDLGRPLDRVLEKAGESKDQVRGVILLTDGRHNRGPVPGDRADRLGERKIPIYPVAFGTRKSGPELAVTGVTANNAVFKAREDIINATVKASLKVRSLPAQELVVELQGMGRTLDQTRITHDGKDRDYPLSFPVSLNQEGTQKLTVSVRPAPGQVHTDNNRRTVAVKVVDDQAEVLLIEGEARWEYHYLASALARDDMVKKAKSVVFVQPRIGRIDEAELERAGHPSLKLPAGPDAFSVYDCVVLGDVSPEQLPRADRKRLEKYVGERGGTLVILAGKRFMPLAFEANGGRQPASGGRQPASGGRQPPGEDAETDPLLRLLPITEPRVVAPPDGFAVSRTEEGKRNPLLQMGEGPKDEEEWAGLPPHYWAVVGHKKPAATTLAYWSGARPGNTEKDRRAAEEEAALIAWQVYGKGRVLYVGIDSTWRWRYKVGDRLHHRFWGQLVRWAAGDKLLEGGVPQVRFGTSRATYQTGEEIDVLVRLADDAVSLKPDAVARARILRQTEGKEEVLADVTLARREAQPRVLEGKVRDLPEGQYRVVLDVPDLADKLNDPKARRAEFLVSPPDSRELLELTADWDLLKDLADRSRSGGKVYAPEEAGKLVELLTREEKQQEDRQENRFREWWPTLLLLLALLTLEWVGRKLAGLP